MDLQEQAREALELYRQFNDKLDRISVVDAQLDRQEQLERRIVRILRALGEQAAPQSQITASR